jgi:branched-chain amino acid transport system substrate-binding protein
MLDERVDAQCVADYGSYDIGYLEDAGVKVARSCPVIGVPAPNEFPRAKRFVAAYRKAFGTAPGTWSPYTFDSVNVLADAIEKTGGFDAAKITDSLNAVDGTEGWTGSITLEAGSGNRDPGTVVLLETTARGVFRIDPAWAQAVGYQP